MEFKHFGSSFAPIIVFYQASCTYWEWYLPSIRELARSYHVVVPVLDGYSTDNKSDFILVENTVDETLKYMNSCGYSIYGVYGGSFGGAMALYSILNSNTPIQKAIVDGGITPYQLPYIITRLILLRDWLTTLLGCRHPRLIEKMLHESDWGKDAAAVGLTMEKMAPFLCGLSSKTIRNSFDLANNYKMPVPVPSTKTEIQYWYGALEEKDRNWDIKYMKKNFPQAEMIPFPQMEHLQVVLTHPEVFGAKASAFFQQS